MTKKRGLGRGLGELGLNELLGDMSAPTTAVLETETQTSPKPNDSLKKLPVDMIGPGPFQPRKDISQEALEELAGSIRAQGVIQPIIVRAAENNHYEIIAGERRWRAAQLAGLHDIPAIVREIPDETAMAIGLIENIQRRDLNSIEEANALQRLVHEFELTHQEVADAVGKSRTVVTNLLRLLKLNPEVRRLVEQGQLEMGHARALLALEGAKQTEIANYIVARGLSVRETERIIRQLQRGDQNATQNGARDIDPNIRRLQSDLSDKLGARVSIQHANNGKGKLVIEYNSVDELNGILTHID